MLEATLGQSAPGLVAGSGLSSGAIAGVIVVVVAAVAAVCLVRRKPKFADDEIQAELVSEPEFKGIYT